jgi:hypothetical protein
MYPGSTPLVPDDEIQERDFIPRDLDQDRDSRNRRQRRSRPAAFQSRSLGRRILKSVGRFGAVVLIGVGLTLTYQSYAEETKDFVENLAPPLAWLLPAANLKKPAEASSSEMLQQMKLLSVDVAIVRRSLGQLAAGQEQLTAKQDQIGQNIMSVQQVAQDIRDQAVAPPAAKPSQPHGHSAPQTAPQVLVPR